MDNTWKPRRLEKKPPRQTPSSDDALNPMQAIQNTLWDSTDELAAKPKKQPKPLEEWKTNDLVTHWSARIAQAQWADHLIGHTNRAGLGKTFKEALTKGHSPAALKATIDTFFDSPRYHDAKKPWTLYRAVINDLLAKVAPAPKPDPWAGAEQTEVPSEITQNWGGHPATASDPWAAAVKR
ncbi:hypothetical protein [Streptomyces sp. PA5.6]|uniref:hypothetical protein n=1 Tax=Streptomyces sp. PA5.6 TaxID=3035651 RepID=UPI00390492C6